MKAERTRKEKTEKTSKAQKLAEDLRADDTPLLAEVISWNARAKVKRTRADIIKALEAVNLDVKYARELLPRHAFARASKELADKRIIDIVREEEKEILFQFTKKEMQKDEWRFQKELTLTLNKESGNVTCDEDQKLEVHAQELVDRYTEERTTSDVTKIVQRLFEANADLFPFRDQGGCYIVLREHFPYVDQVESFINALNGKMNRLPIPERNVRAKSEVMDLVADGIQKMVDEHLEAIKNFTIHTRGDTLEGAAKRINDTRVKIEAYARYLMGRGPEMLQVVEDAKGILDAKIAEIAGIKASMPARAEGESGRDLLFGHSITAVIRWMGKNQWKFDQAKKALAAKDITVADATLRAQLHAGRNGARGEPATLTKAQAQELASAV